MFDKKTIIICIGSAVVFLISLFLQIPDDKFHIYFLNVGQGDSILIKTPDNHQILIDGGSKNYVMEELAKVMPFFDKSIDMVILTHPHADHVEGLAEVLNRYEVENVLYTGVLSDEASYVEFLRIVNEKNISNFFAESGTDFHFGDVYLDIIYPFQSIGGKKVENLNNSSISIRLIYGEKIILLTGDLEKEGENELIFSGIDLSADILKAGHHGSRTASTMDFLEEVQPEIFVIQSGADNTFGHPHPESIRNFYRAGGEKVYRNDLDGMVEFVF